VLIAFKEKTGEAVITVRDTGAGIPENVKGKLFTPCSLQSLRGKAWV